MTFVQKGRFIRNIEFKYFSPLEQRVRLSEDLKPELYLAVLFSTNIKIGELKYDPETGSWKFSFFGLMSKEIARKAQGDLGVEQLEHDINLVETELHIDPNWGVL